MTHNSFALTGPCTQWWCFSDGLHSARLCFMWCLRTLSCPCCSVYAKPMCATSQPQRPAGATCVSRASSAKWNCHQATPEVLENLVLVREHNRLCFCQRGYIQQQRGSRHAHDPRVKKVELVLLAFIIFQETIMGYLTKCWPWSHASVKCWIEMCHKGKAKRTVTVTPYDPLW